ncbi:MAG: hypothetical protein CFH30_00411 [Alphaproteobacteria bacterium MarineAlpha8_Bin1]|nr:MAG: hypothetical protein CFH30_00411 [Alphaproteobacteria bacterium MarineAlpha8_Bin1]|tara:strand:+ start:372 stop:722 length:351 start_codon:yes stop_codon:yes gene_type:complete
MVKEKKIEDLLESIYKLVQEAKEEKQNILSKNDLNLSKSLEKNKKGFIDSTFIANDLNNSKDNILENLNKKNEFLESVIENKFKLALSFWSKKKLKLLLREEFDNFSKNLINSKLK